MPRLIAIRYDGYTYRDKVYLKQPWKEVYLEHTARPVLPKALGVLKYATSQNLTLDEL